MEEKLIEQKKCQADALVSEAIRQEKEEKEKQAVDQMDSDANLPISDSDEDEDGPIKPSEEDLDGVTGERKRGVKA